MKPEDKELLFKDLCARLPYGVVLDIDTTDWKAPQGHIKLKIEGIGILFKDMSLIVNGAYYGDKYKPYLRPMSSMTKEEYNELEELIRTEDSNLNLSETTARVTIDWLNKNMFDFRGLIPKDLALSTEIYNPYKE